MTLEDLRKIEFCGCAARIIKQLTHGELFVALFENDDQTHFAVMTAPTAFVLEHTLTLDFLLPEENGLNADTELSVFCAGGGPEDGMETYIGLLHDILLHDILATYPR